MARTITTIQGCYEAWPGKTIEGEQLQYACVRAIEAGRTMEAPHLGGVVDWEAIVGAGQLPVAAAILALWLVLLVKALRQPHLRPGQKVGWALGLTLCLPVFALLWLVLAPGRGGTRVA